MTPYRGRISLGIERLDTHFSLRAWQKLRRFARESHRSTRDALREAQRSPERVGLAMNDAQNRDRLYLEANRPPEIGRAHV